MGLSLCLRITLFQFKLCIVQLIRRLIASEVTTDLLLWLLQYRLLLFFLLINGVIV